MPKINGIDGGCLVVTGFLQFVNRGNEIFNIRITDELKDAVTRREQGFTQDGVTMSFPEKGIVYLSSGKDLVEVSYAELFMLLI